MTPAAARLAEALKVATQVREHEGAGALARALGAAGLVVMHGGDDDAVVAALLMPAVDADAGVLPHLTTRFGARVGVMLAAIRDDHRAMRIQGEASHDDPEGWRASRLRRLMRLDAADDTTLLVAACDALHQVRTLVEALESPEVGRDAFRDTPGGEALVLRDAHAMAHLCLVRGVSPARALDRAVDRLHALAHTPMREGLGD